MKKHQIVIGIDPDTEKSGVAFLELATKTLEAACLEFPVLIDYLKTEKEKADKNGLNLIVVVEAAWLIPKSNWHGKQGGRAEKIAKNVGANHETGKKIIEMCKHLKIPVVEQRPLKKIWTGRNGKITHEEIQKITGLTGRTNQEVRDAALIAWVWAGFSVRV